MDIKIIKTIDTDILAKLNKDVQEIHYNIEPDIFKPYSEVKMKELFDELIKDESTSAYIIYFKKSIAGYMVVCQKDYEENAFRNNYSVIYIEQICVAEEFKGKGIGKALVDFAKEYAKKLDINRVEMNYWSKNNNSGEFFRSQGFETFNERLTFKI